MEDENTRISSEFACYKHPDRKGTYICWRCQQPICEQCSETLLGRTYCQSCAEEVETMNSEPDNTSVLKREINSPLLMIVIIIITLIIAGVEIYVMTK